MSMEKLLEMKKITEKAIQDQAEVRGETNLTNELMKRDFNVDDLDEAEKKLKEIGSEIDQEQGEYEERFEKLENSFPKNEGDE